MHEQNSYNQTHVQLPCGYNTKLLQHYRFKLKFP